MKKENVRLLAIGAIWVAVVFILLGLCLVAASGFVKIPLMTQLFGADKPRDLGVRTDPAYFQDILTRHGIKIVGEKGRLCLECYSEYADMKPIDISVTSNEISSWIAETNKEGTLKDVQIRLGSANSMELSANLDLRKHGYDFISPVYLIGKITKGSSNTLEVEITKAQAGIVPIPGEFAKQGAEELENTINRQLARMPDLEIGEFSVENGVMRYKGNFPTVVRSGG
jgi:hypothetical protein